MKTLHLGRFYRPFRVANWRSASKIWSEIRNREMWESGTHPHGLIYEDDAVVAYVSWNGRVWAGMPLDWRLGQTPLYDPLPPLDPIIMAALRGERASLPTPQGGREEADAPLVSGTAS